jgi:hypothetical protein
MTEPRRPLPPSTTTTTPTESTTLRPTTRSTFRGSQAGGLRLFDLDVVVFASLLKAPLSNYVRTQILLLLLTMCIRAYVFEPSRPLACNINLVLFYFMSRVVLWYLPVSPWAWSCAFACMISARSIRGRHNLRYQIRHEGNGISKSPKSPTSFGLKTHPFQMRPSSISSN